MLLFNLDSLKEQLALGELGRFEAGNYYRLALGVNKQVLEQASAGYHNNSCNVHLTVLSSGNIIRIKDRATNLLDAKGTILNSWTQGGFFGNSCYGPMLELPNGQVLDQPSFSLWDVNTGKCIKAINDGVSPSALAVLSEQHVVVSTRRSKSEYCLEYFLEIWDIQTGKCVKSIKAHNKAIKALAVLPDNRVISGSSDGTIKIWDMPTAQCVQMLEGHTSGVSALLLLPNGQLVSGGLDGKLKVWEISSGRCLSTLNQVSSFTSKKEQKVISAVTLTLLPDGLLLSHSKSLDSTSYGDYSSLLKVWDIALERCVQTLDLQEGTLAILADNGLITGSRNGEIVVRPFQRRKLEYVDIAPLLGFAKKCFPGSFEELSLEGVILGEPGYQMMLRIIQNYSALQSLNLNNTGLTIPQQTALGRACQQKGIAVTGLPAWEEKSGNNIVLCSDSSFKEALKAPSIPIRAPASLDASCTCPITHQLMFAPMVAADGHTYEEEAIKKHLETSNKSPMTNEQLPHTFLIPNRGVRSMIQEFLTHQPTYWAEVYLPQTLKNQALTALQSRRPEELRNLLQSHPGLLTSNLDAHSGLLLEAVAHQPTQQVSLFLHEILAQLKPHHWHELIQIKSTYQWLEWAASLEPSNLVEAKAFIEQLKANLAIDFSSMAFALDALERGNEHLFRLAVALLPDINQVVDDQKNTLLHLAGNHAWYLSLQTRELT